MVNTRFSIWLTSKRNHEFNVGIGINRERVKNMWGKDKYALERDRMSVFKRNPFSRPNYL